MPSHKKSYTTAFLKLAPIIVLLCLWQLLCSFALIPAFLLPSPLEVVTALIKDSTLLAQHAAASLTEAVIGLVIGLVLGCLLALLMDSFKPISKALEPLLTLSQTIPTVAIAPLLVLWLGYDMLPKIVLVVLTTFFPITIAFLTGLKSCDPDLIDLLKTMKANSWQIFCYVKLPAALPHLLSGLKISASYAIVAAVISEWLGGDSGLGVYMTRVRKSFSYDRMFASIFVTSGLSLALIALIDLFEHISMPWKRRTALSSSKVKE